MKLPLKLIYGVCDYLNFQNCIKVSYTYSMKMYNYDLHTFTWCIKNDLKHVMEFFIFIKKPIKHYKEWTYGWTEDDVCNIKNKTKELYDIYITKYKDDLLLSKIINQCIEYDNIKLLDKIYKIQKPNISCYFYKPVLKYVNWVHENLKECCRMSYFTQAICQKNFDVIKYILDKHPDKFKKIDLGDIKYIDSDIYKLLIDKNITFCCKKIYTRNGIEDIVYEEGPTYTMVGNCWKINQI